MYFLAEVCCIYLNLRWWLLLLLLCGCCCYYCCCNNCFCCWRWCSFHYHIISDIVIKIMIIQQILIINWLINFTPLYFYLLSLFRSDWLISLLCFWNHMVLTMWIRPCVNNNLCNYFLHQLIVGAWCIFCRQCILMMLNQKMNWAFQRVTLLSWGRCIFISLSYLFILFYIQNSSNRPGDWKRKDWHFLWKHFVTDIKF